MAAKSAGIECLFECCICLGECQDPRLLPCAHSLCRHCLEEHITSSAKGGLYQCPSCRHTCNVPAEGASGFPKNFILNNLRDILQKQSGECEPVDAATKGKDLECSNKHMDTIPHTSVTVFCVECTDYLCSNCEHFHPKIGGESHELQPVDGAAATGGQDIKRRRRKPRCEQHPALSKDMYCDTCQVLMCMKCCLLKHQLHKYRELDDLTEEKTAKLTELTQTAEKRYTVLDQHLKKLDAMKKNMDSDAEKAYREVHEAADELRDYITKREQTLIQEIKDIHAVALTEINAAYKETELNKARLQSLLSYIHALQESGNVSHQVVHTPGLQEQLWQQETSLMKSVSWTVDIKRNTENVATVNALLGTVSKEQTVDRSVSCDDKKAKLKSPILTLTPNMTALRVCAGITKITGCVCVVGSGEPHLWMHNLKENSNKQCTIRDLKAAGMTTFGNSSNTLIITDSKKKLHFITINPHNMSITKQLSKDISFQPQSVMYDHPTDKLIIANRSDKQIVICNKTGDIEKRITVKAKVKYLWCALPTAGDAYIVLDKSSSGRVHWVNQSGDVTHTYGAGAGEGLFDPRHMLQDSQGRLLVADRANHRICLITNQQFSHDLITKSDGIQYPDFIYLDETKRTLFVGCGPHCFEVNMYKWPFTSASPADVDTLSKCFKISINLGRYQ